MVGPFSLSEEFKGDVAVTSMHMVSEDKITEWKQFQSTTEDNPRVPCSQSPILNRTTLTQALLWSGGVTSPWAHVSEHLLPSWWCCSGTF